MTASRTDRAPLLLEHLRGRLRGAALAPGDERYDTARRAWNINAEHRPALVVLAEDAADIRTAVRFARREGLCVGVLATGHGTGVPCDGLLFNTSRMRTVRVDPGARIARVDAGAVWEDVIGAAAAHGLAGLPGSSARSASSDTPSEAASGGWAGDMGWPRIPSPAPRSSRPTAS